MFIKHDNDDNDIKAVQKKTEQNINRNYVWIVG